MYLYVFVDKNSIPISGPLLPIPSQGVECPTQNDTNIAKAIETFYWHLIDANRYVRMVFAFT